MHSSFVKSCLLALATVSTVVAQTANFDPFIAPIEPGSSIPAGSTYDIKWTPTAPSGSISLILLEGNTNTTLQLGPKIASRFQARGSCMVSANMVVGGIDSKTGSYSWSISTSLQYFPVYGIKLQLDSDTKTFQYSTYFSITGLSGSSSSGSSGSVTMTTATSTPTTTMKVSQVGPTTSTSALNSSTSVSTSSVIFPNSTITRTSTSAGGASTGSPSLTSSTIAPSSTNGAIGGAAGGAGLLGSLLISLGMLL